MGYKTSRRWFLILLAVVIPLGSLNCGVGTLGGGQCLPSLDERFVGCFHHQDHISLGYISITERCNQLDGFGSALMSLELSESGLWTFIGDVTAVGAARLDIESDDGPPEITATFDISDGPENLVLQRSGYPSVNLIRFICP